MSLPLMTLHEILDVEFSYCDHENNLNYPRSRIIFEIKQLWGIDVENDELTQVIEQKEHINDSGEIAYTFYTFFNSTPALLKKFKGYPEALI